MIERTPLPDTRASITKVFRLADTDERGHSRIVQLYFTASTYEDGRPGEVFAKADKQGSLISGLLDGVAIEISLGLQYGIPLEVLVKKLRGMEFAPKGFTKDTEIPSCTSVLDLLARWLLLKFPPKTE